MIDKSELFKCIEDRKALFSKIESFSGKCKVDDILQSIEVFHDLSSRIRSLNMDCFNSHLISRDDYYKIRAETSEMYSQIKKIVNGSLREKCNVEWYAI